MDNTRLINIYIKIHNKKNITLDDLRYLAEYSPECFEKTCKNVVYNIPETKPIMEPEAPKTSESPTQKQKEEPSEQFNISKILENIKRLEMNDFPVTNVDADKVKSLLGNLYMELLFPHNDKETFIEMEKESKKSLFDKKV